jgi:hypothetical protein
LARILGEATVGAARIYTFLGQRYRRLAKRRGKKRALVAIGRSILVIAWLRLFDPDGTLHDLGRSFHNAHTATDTARRNHIRQLEALGDKVTLEPAAGATPRAYDIQTDPGREPGSAYQNMAIERASARLTRFLHTAGYRHAHEARRYPLFGQMGERRERLPVAA